MDFDVVGEDGKSYQIKNSSSAEPFLVAKNGLSPEMQAVIEAKKPAPASDDMQAQEVARLSQPGFGDRAGITPEVPQDQIQAEAAKNVDLFQQSKVRDEQSRLASQARADAMNRDQLGGNVPGGSSMLASVPPTNDGTPVQVKPGQLPQGQPAEAGHVPISQLAVPPSQIANKPGANPFDDARKGLLGGYGQEASGIRKEADLGAQRAAQEAGYYQETSKQLAKMDLEAQQRRQQEQVELDSANQKYKEVAADAANTKIDPNHFWSNLSTGGKITAAISIALGSLGGSMSGRGGNQALDIINGAIDRDMQAQKLEADKKQQAVGNQQNIVQMMRSKFSDRNQADLAAKMAMMDRVGMDIKANTAKFQGPELQARAQQLMGQLSIKRTEAQTQFDMMVRQQSALMGMGGGGDGVANPLMLPKEYQERAVRMPNGKYQVAATSEGAKDLNKTIPEINSMKDTIQKLKDLSGTTLPYSEKSKQAQALLSELTFQNQKVEGLSRLSKEDIGMIEHQFSDPTGLRPGVALKLLDQKLGLLNGRTDQLYRQHIPNYQPINFTASK